jgi:hypothetical protein
MQEHDFILNYARLNPEPFAGLDNLNWNYIFQQSNIHKVAPLLYNNIKTLPVPGDILKKFEYIYTHTALRNMLYLEELNKILNVFEREGIKCVILKGPCLAQNVYHNIALRPFLDIDLLIKKEDIQKTVLILKKAGYTSQNEKFYLKYHFHLPLFKQGKTPFNIELHWDIADKFILHKTDINKIIDLSENNTLPDDINILYLLLHIEKHAFFNKAIYNEKNPRDWIFENPLDNQLIWYTDIYELLKKSNLKINNLTKIAEEWCIENCFYYNLYILNKLYPIEELSNLPQPKLGFIKRFIYTTAAKRENKFKIEKNIQLRPIRIIDTLNYLFPPRLFIRKYYCARNTIFVMILQIFHFFRGTISIIREFFGICIQTIRGSKTE